MSKYETTPKLDAQRIAEVIPQLAMPHVGAPSEYLVDLNTAVEPWRRNDYRKVYADPPAIVAHACLQPVLPLFVARHRVARYLSRNRNDRTNAILAAFCDLGIMYPSTVSDDTLAMTMIIMAVHLPPTPFCAISVWPDREFIAIRTGQLHHGQTIYLDATGERVE